MTRLSDEELNEAMDIANSLHSLRLVAALSELRALRAAALTAEEVEALRPLPSVLEAVYERACLDATITALLCALDRCGNQRLDDDRQVGAVARVAVRLPRPLHRRPRHHAARGGGVDETRRD